MSNRFGTSFHWFFGPLQDRATTEIGTRAGLLSEIGTEVTLREHANMADITEQRGKKSIVLKQGYVPLLGYSRYKFDTARTSGVHVVDTFRKSCFMRLIDTRIVLRGKLEYHFILEIIFLLNISLLLTDHLKHV